MDDVTAAAEQEQEGNRIADVTFSRKTRYGTYGLLSG